jgi:putative glutamine amidotransferase
MVAGHPFHMVGEKYVTAVRDAAEAVPLLIPVLDPPMAPTNLLAIADGFLFTGSPSNVSRRYYGGMDPRDDVLLDEKRDSTTLPLLKAAVEKGAPVLSVCRGFQELNVAFGGTLHQHVHELEGRFDHRENETADLESQFGPAHEVRVVDSGLLSQLAGLKDFQVNSLHAQGIDRLAPALHADAVAPDGTIEAVSMPGVKGFVLGLQWHPEWCWRENEISRAIFAAFGSALRERAAREPTERQALYSKSPPGILLSQVNRLLLIEWRQTAATIRSNLLYNLDSRAPHNRTSTIMDAIDRLIVAALQEDAALSFAEVGKRVGLSPTPCWKRIQRLEKGSAATLCTLRVT